MKNKGLLFFSLVNLGAGVWNLTNVFHGYPLVATLFALGMSIFSFSISALTFWTFFVTNNLKIENKLTKLGYLVAIQFAVTVANMLPTSCGYHCGNGWREVDMVTRWFTINGILPSWFWLVPYPLVAIGMVVKGYKKHKALNRVTMPSIGGEKK